MTCPIKTCGFTSKASTLSWITESRQHRKIDMTPTLHADPIPLRLDSSGVLRVGDTRVTLDTVVHAYRDGASPEEIVLRYDSLGLAEVHAVIAYFLRHRAEVDEYLVRRTAQAAEVRKQVEARQGVQAVRERLQNRLRKESP
jgi:uncharacterized protein (DUF433 family)